MNFEEYRAATVNALAATDAQSFSLLSEALDKCFADGKRAFVFGNGASASLADHMAADFNNQQHRAIGSGPNRRILEFRSLPANISQLTAIANDMSFQDVFADQLLQFGTDGDIALAITGSGASANVVRGLETAKLIGLRTATLTGRIHRRPQAAEYSDVLVQVPSDRIDIVENVHVTLQHALLRQFMRTNYGK